MGFNHVGDPAYDGAEGGRLLLPLECYVPGRPNGGNTCGRGGIGVADPATLAWRYWVALDPADIPKAMWAEVSPDGSLLWTSAGADLLAYATADINPANAAPGPDAAPIHPVRAPAGAVPPSGITGAVFADGRLLPRGRGWAACCRCGRSTSPARRGARWRSSCPASTRSRRAWTSSTRPAGCCTGCCRRSRRAGQPTYGAGHSELLSFVAACRDDADAAASRREAPRRERTRITATVRHVYAGRPHPSIGARVSAAGHAATTNAQGVARLRIRRSAPASRRQGDEAQAEVARARRCAPSADQAATGSPFASMAAADGARAAPRTTP